MKLEKIKSIKRIGIEQTYDLIVQKNHNFIANGIIVHNSGWGKGLCGEGIVERLHQMGYLILVIADPKDELEWAYAQFEADEMYHIKELKKIGKMPSKKNVKLYHPFTFNIPHTLLPEFNFYTFSLKDLGRKEWGMLAETSWDTDTIKLLINASQNISKEDGLYGILHYLQDMVRGKRERRKINADPKNFYLSSTSGTMKSIQDISNYLQPFKRDYFLAKDNCPLNLDWKEILSNQEDYHVFVSNFIKDPKLKEFVVLTLFNKIIENKSLLKHPVCIVIPEVRKLVPFRPQGYQLFLSEAIKENLSTMRSIGKGMSSILDSQVFSGVDEEVSNSATIMLIGELGGARDIEKLSKAMNYKRDIRQQLSKMDYENSFFIAGKEDVGAIKIWFPSHMHCEPSYDFFDMYKRHYYEKMTEYTDIIGIMKKDYLKEEQKFKEKVKRIRREEKERAEREAREREAKTSKSKGVEQKMEKAKEVEKKGREQLMRLCYEFKQKNPEISLRQIGKEFGINHITVRKYIDNYSKIVEQKEEGEAPLLGEDFELPKE